MTEKTTSALDESRHISSVAEYLRIRRQHRLKSPMARRHFMASAATASAAVFSSGLWKPQTVHAAHKAPCPLPKPIPGGFPWTNTKTGEDDFFHLFLPDQSLLPEIDCVEPSTITDFDGVVGFSIVRGTGLRITPDGEKCQCTWENDSRFMQGKYRGKDGKLHWCTFGFT